MNAPDLPNATAEKSPASSALARLMDTLGANAKVASAQVARASTATKNKALLGLAALLRQNAVALQAANQHDLERAAAAGLAGPLLDRLKLNPCLLYTSDAADE